LQLSGPESSSKGSVDYDYDSRQSTHITHRSKRQIFVGGAILKAGRILGTLNRQVCRGDTSPTALEHLATGILEGGTTHEQSHHHCHGVALCRENKVVASFQNTNSENVTSDEKNDESKKSETSLYRV
jgi:hypothetical protein